MLAAAQPTTTIALGREVCTAPLRWPALAFVHRLLEEHGQLERGPGRAGTTCRSACGRPRSALRLSWTSCRQGQLEPRLPLEG